MNVLFSQTLSTGLIKKEKEKEKQKGPSFSLLFLFFVVLLNFVRRDQMWEKRCVFFLFEKIIIIVLVLGDFEPCSLNFSLFVAMDGGRRNPKNPVKERRRISAFL